MKCKHCGNVIVEVDPGDWVHVGEGSNRLAYCINVGKPMDEWHEIGTEAEPYLKQETLKLIKKYING